MPGYANWKQLFDEELFQMREEGYDLRDLPSYGDNRSFLLPFPGCEQPETDADAWPLDDFIPEQSPGSGNSARKDCMDSTKGNIRYARSDDDIHYTLLALLLAEKYGVDFKPEHVGRNWLDNIPYHWCWCASRQAYYHMA